MQEQKVDYWQAILENGDEIRVIRTGHGYQFQAIDPYEKYVSAILMNIKDDKELLQLEQFIQKIRKGK